MGLSGRLMILVGRSLYLGAINIAQQFAAIAWRRAVRMRSDFLRLHYRDLNLHAILSFEVLKL